MPADTTVAFDAAVFVAFGGSRTAARQAIAHGQYVVDGAIVRDPDARVALVATVTTVAQLAAELTERFPALVASMKNHDWYYDFSDDRDAWRRGKASHEKIEAALDALPDADARALRSVFGRRYRRHLLKVTTPPWHALRGCRHGSILPSVEDPRPVPSAPTPTRGGDAVDIQPIRK